MFNPFEGPKNIEDRQRAIETIASFIKTSAGRELFKYLLTELYIGELPAIGLDDGQFKSEMLGYMRAGRALFDLISEANTYEAGYLLAEIQKEKIYAAKMDSNGQG